MVVAGEEGGGTVARHRALAGLRHHQDKDSLAVVVVVVVLLIKRGEEGAHLLSEAMVVEVFLETVVLEERPPLVERALRMQAAAVVVLKVLPLVLAVLAVAVLEVPIRAGEIIQRQTAQQTLAAAVAVWR